MQETLLNCVSYRGGRLYWNDKAPLHQHKPVGCRDYQGYTVFGFKGRQYKEHRVIWFMHNGPIPKGYMIDHIDRNPSNNDIENLRIVTNSENQRNIKAPGVRKKGCKWEARASVNEVREHLGTFSCFGEAIKKVKNNRLFNGKTKERDTD